MSDHNSQTVRSPLTWDEFISEVAERHRRGETDEQISMALGNNEFSWQGTIHRLRLDSAYTSGVEFQMPECTHIVGAGKFIKASYLFVNVDPEDRKIWAKLSESTNVTFSVLIPAIEYGFVLGIKVSTDDIDNEAIVLIGTKHGKPIGISKVR